MTYGHFSKKGNFYCSFLAAFPTHFTTPVAPDVALAALLLQQPSSLPSFDMSSSIVTFPTLRNKRNCSLASFYVSFLNVIPVCSRFGGSCHIKPLSQFISEPFTKLCISQLTGVNSTLITFERRLKNSKSELYDCDKKLMVRVNFGFAKNSNVQETGEYQVTLWMSLRIKTVPPMTRL